MIAIRINLFISLRNENEICKDNIIYFNIKDMYLYYKYNDINR